VTEKKEAPPKKESKSKPVILESGIEVKPVYGPDDVKDID